MRARARRRLGGFTCSRQTHRPVLAERHYCVSTGTIELAGEGLLSGRTFPNLGRRAEERHGRDGICRRCLAPCGDTIPGVAR